MSLEANVTLIEIDALIAQMQTNLAQAILAHDRIPPEDDCAQFRRHARESCRMIARCVETAQLVRRVYELAAGAA
jgi:hypothetical protein